MSIRSHASALSLFFLLSGCLITELDTGELPSGGPADPGPTDPGDPTEPAGPHYAAPLYFAVGSAAGELAAADFDDDGDLDLVTANAYPMDLSLLLNNGDGTFADALSIPLGAQLRSVRVADLDLDGRPDIAAWGSFSPADSSYQEGRVHVLFGLGGAAFSAPLVLAVPSDFHSIDPESLALGDVNGDALPDIAATTGREGAVKLFLNQGGRQFGAAETVNTESGTTPSFVGAVDIGDVTGDGRADLVMSWGMVGPVAQLSVFGGPPAAPELQASALPGGLLAPVTTPAGGAFGRRAQVVDLDGDEAQDVVVTNVNTDDLDIFMNDGAGGLTLAATLPMGMIPDGLLAADLDEDGDIDIALGESVFGELRILLNEGDLGFVQQSPNLTELYTITSIVNGDFNGDGHADLAVALMMPWSDSEDGAVAVLLADF
jgi:hypothetical protein